MSRYAPTEASGLTGKDDRSWVVDAACSGTDTESFYLDGGTVPHVIRKICGNCPVQLACLEYAVLNVEIYGVWGGSSPRERRAYARAHMLTADAPQVSHVLASLNAAQPA